MHESALNTRVGQLLNKSSYLPGRKLLIETHSGKVVLRGTVRTFYQKQMAQEMVRGLEGVEHVENQLEVSWS